MNLPRHKLLILGALLILIGIVMRIYDLQLSDLVFGFGLLITLSAAFLFTYNAKEKGAGNDR